ncbi:hypothetical protein [Thermoactinospora rubra]|uniref:hypothetical protein n=1 Tax=Thermoactinospora rubra TaxID=1088767 RepID=UPI000A100479|nr:hypothetical protein [Thermoactinospora rubra]
MTTYYIGQEEWWSREVTGGVHAKVSRWFVVVVLAFGIACMHSLGHVRGDHSIGGHGMPQHAQTSHTVPPGSDTPMLDPTDVCVAIMASFLVLWLIAVAGRIRRHLLLAPFSGFPRSDRTARPPPKKVAARLAELSVLRI